MCKYFFLVIISLTLSPTSSQAITQAELVRAFPGIKKILSPTHIRHAYPLFSYPLEIEEEKLETLARALKKIPSHSIQEVSSSALTLLGETKKKSKHVSTIIRFIDAIDRLPKGQRKEISELAIQGLQEKNTLDDMIGALRIIERTRELFPEASVEEQISICRLLPCPRGYAAAFMNARQYKDATSFIKGAMRVLQEANSQYPQTSAEDQESICRNVARFYSLGDFSKDSRHRANRHFETLVSLAKQAYDLQISELLTDEYIYMFSENDFFQEWQNFMNRVSHYPQEQRVPLTSSLLLLHDGEGELHFAQKIFFVTEHTPSQTMPAILSMIGGDKDLMHLYYNSLRAVNDKAAFTEEILQRYRTAERDAQDLTENAIELIIVGSRDHVTEQEARIAMNAQREINTRRATHQAHHPRQRPRHQPVRVTTGQAYEVHNAVKVPVIYNGKKQPAYKVVKKILKHLDIHKMSLRNCLKEMQALSGLQNPDKVKTALNKAYWDPEVQERDALAYNDLITPLLKYVWPYMKTRPEETQKAWLQSAVAEAYTAYEGSSDIQRLSCSKGIQERLTVTGFEVGLEGVDARLIAISTLSKFAAAAPNETLQQSLHHLLPETYQRILALKTLSQEDMRSFFLEGLNGLGRSVPAFQNKEGLQGLEETLPDDFAHLPHFQKLLPDYIELYANPEYKKLADLKSIATKKSQPTEEVEADADLA